jgi:hypothetical protein
MLEPMVSVRFKSCVDYLKIEIPLCLVRVEIWPASKLENVLSRAIPCWKKSPSRLERVENLNFAFLVRFRVVKCQPMEPLFAKIEKVGNLTSM